MKKILLSGGLLVSALAVVVGATYAAWTATGSVEGNTVSAATIELTVDVDGVAQGGAVDKPVDASNMLPGDITGEYAVEITNSSTVPVKLSMYADDVNGSGGICAALKFNQVRLFGDNYFDTVLPAFAGLSLHPDLNGEETAVEIAASVDPGEVIRVYQRLELDSDAPNSAQGQTCDWSEVFVAETL